jgi:hypothetical protein
MFIATIYTKEFFLINYLHLPSIYPLKLENSKKDLLSLSKNIVSDRTSKHDYMFPLFNILNNNVSQFNIM